MRTRPAVPSTSPRGRRLVVSPGRLIKALLAAAAASPLLPKSPLDKGDRVPPCSPRLQGQIHPAGAEQEHRSLVLRLPRPLQPGPGQGSVRANGLQQVGGCHRRTLPFPPFFVVHKPLLVGLALLSQPCSDGLSPCKHSTVLGDPSTIPTLPCSQSLASPRGAAAGLVCGAERGCCTQVQAGLGSTAAARC